MIDIDALAQEIRRVDGNHELGAGALAEALVPFITAALAAMPAPAVRVKLLEDLEEVRKAVFGDAGDEPDVYADYDRCSELSGKMRKAIDALTPAPSLAAENERLREALEFVTLWAWREDPPNANRKLTDEERLSAIKYHPSIRAAPIRAALEDRT